MFNPLPETNIIGIKFKDDGFYFSRDNTDTTKSLQNLIKIKRILQENMPYTQSCGIIESGNSPPPSEIVNKLVEAAKANKLYLASSDGDNAKAENLFARIQSLAPGYQPRSDTAIAMEIGWQGGGESTQFLDDFREIIHVLQKAEILDEDDVKFLPNQNIDLISTYERIEFRVGPDIPKTKKEQIIALTEKYLKEDKANQVLILSLLFRFLGDNESGLNIFDKAAQLNAANCMNILAIHYNPGSSYRPLFNPPKNEGALLKSFEKLLDEEDVDVEKKFTEIDYLLADCKDTNGVISLLNKFKEKGLDFTKKTTALRAALSAENYPLFKALLDSKVDPNKELKVTGSLLIDAVQKNAPNFVQALIQAGVDINYVHHGRTALHWAIKQNRNEIALNLIDAGAVIGFNEYNAMLTAMETGNVLIFDKLLEKVVSNQKINNEENISWLIFALQGDNSRAIFVLKLLEAGMNLKTIERPGRYPLVKAITSNSINFEGAQLYVDGGGDINAKNQSGDTLLHSAVINGSAPWVEFLLGSGADRELDNSKGFTPLQLAERSRLNNIVAIFQKHDKKKLA